MKAEAAMEAAGAPPPPAAIDKDDDGRPKRQGTVWSAAAHVITGVIGSGVLSLAWSFAQLGWIAGPIVLLIFAYLTYYTSALLADCYRFPDPTTGKRNYRYKDAVKVTLGRVELWLCALAQYSNLAATAVGYTVTGALSMAAIARANCFHTKGSKALGCGVSVNLYVTAFGLIQLVFSQIPNFHELWWLSYLATAMSFTYSTIVLVLGLAKLIGNGRVSGSPGGLVTTPAQKTWAVFQALGNVAFAYSFSMILIEIQDTLRSTPPENKTMKKATLVGVLATTAFYMSIACVNYAAFGDSAPGNLLSQGFEKPYWLIDFSNACIVLHLVGAYQVYSQPLFDFVEAWALEKWPHSALNTTHKIKLLHWRYSTTLFRLVWRSLFVIATTVIAMAIPFFNDVLGLLGAMGFWPLTVYFPIQMHIKQAQIKTWSMRWLKLQAISAFCLVISIAAGIGSIEGIYQDLKAYTPFHANF
ncbi:amino acid permease 3 [Selaginella moellendorffii]|uniref:amino acid permease 3 n=1 Tax=Selaginella moellendorffii TaxID=88036 RepID=UPI000D1C2A3B|nr:amino acid permease 3 [Selaginella moellendorffii]|eukprot:XP_024524519.1 amino acid permease 3 [Selaginella moellendorffii]